MKLIRCPKCGATVTTDESLLQSILDAMEDANRAAEKGPSRKRNANLQRSAEYRSMLKSLMHNLTMRDHAQIETPAILSELRGEIIRRGLMTEDELNAVYAAGSARAQAERQKYDREIERLYGDFYTMCNRTMPDPTGREALKKLGRETV